MRRRKLRWLIWEQRSDGRYVYDVVDTQEEARGIAEKNASLYYDPTYSDCKKGDLITMRFTRV